MVKPQDGKGQRFRSESKYETLIDTRAITTSFHLTFLTELTIIWGQRELSSHKSLHLCECKDPVPVIVSSYELIKQNLTKFNWANLFICKLNLHSRGRISKSLNFVTTYCSIKNTKPPGVSAGLTPDVQQTCCRALCW